MEFLSGNQAIVKAAFDVGARFYSGYPITPASEIMTEWSVLSRANKNLIFLQAEDELAAFHQVLGAAISGIPSFTATSGPGLSLMQEGLGLAFVYQAPLVVIDVMRSGPSTGAPTRAGQGEILASRYGSHGDIYPFVFYPTSVQQCYDYTIKAFKIAWEYQTPVILLSDAYLAHMEEKLKVKSEKLKINSQSSNISHYSGLISRKRNAQKINQLKKIAESNYRDFNLWGNKQSKTLLIGLGSMARALRAFEPEFQILAPVRIWPFLSREIKQLAENKQRVVVIEMNQGQYVEPIRRVLGDKVEFIAYQDEVIDIDKLKRLINGK